MIRITVNVIIYFHIYSAYSSEDESGPMVELNYSGQKRLQGSNK